MKALNATQIDMNNLAQTLTQSTLTRALSNTLRDRKYTERQTHEKENRREAEQQTAEQTANALFYSTVLSILSPLFAISVLVLFSHLLA